MVKNWDVIKEKNKIKLCLKGGLLFDIIELVGTSLRWLLIVNKETIFFVKMKGVKSASTQKCGAS